MQFEKIKGSYKKIYKLIMGNDNPVDYEQASVLWNHWIEADCNAFNNAHIYACGSMESLLGQWQKSRYILKDLVIIAKGALTPNCNPKSITLQSSECLDRLQTESANI